MLPEIVNLKIESKQEDQNSYDLENNFLFDFKKNEFVMKDGKLVEVKGIESLKVWIEKVIRTQKYRWKIYEDTGYGTTIEDLIIGHSYPKSFLESELKRELTEAIIKHPAIKNLTEWDFTRGSSSLLIKFRVNLNNGDKFTQKVDY